MSLGTFVQGVLSFFNLNSKFVKNINDVLFVCKLIIIYIALPLPPPAPMTYVKMFSLYGPKNATGIVLYIHSSIEWAK
jgi:hypothetical protein